jgi:hypothetical protein
MRTCSGSSQRARGRPPTGASPQHDFGVVDDRHHVVQPGKAAIPLRVIDEEFGKDLVEDAAGREVLWRGGDAGPFRRW